ncbi:hypothetical protein MPDQ_002869 [Monascus purpureus]|uniref:Uncharacterized protein n=1 Tax=Monascus purpureus TaxID=5098 RepID=A0A507QM72_MONPU|nr:hypothetical protein MPDQ_002869 [Monascus purpureus]BDD56977.1 hypothetical protein MAP00_002390 [Monascus purpureus]
MADGLNQARALRVAEIINDYRTLLVHISQQSTPVPQEEYYEEGYVVMRECLAAAQSLMSSNYNPHPMPGNGDEESEKMQLQRVILDSSARRFQAHKIYLRIAAAKRWAMNRAVVLRGHRPTGHHSSQLKAVDRTFREELAQITDQHVLADLRAADMRAGYWVNEDPSLNSIIRWIRSSS